MLGKLAGDFRQPCSRATALGGEELSSCLFGFHAKKPVGFDLDGGEQLVQVFLGADDMPSAWARCGTAKESFDGWSLEGTDHFQQKGMVVVGEQEPRLATLIGVHAMLRRWRWAA